MTVAKVIARIYDNGPGSVKPAKASGSGFDEMMATATQAGGGDSDVKVASSESKVEATSTNSKAEATSSDAIENDSQSESSQYSVAYEFSMFVRLSGNFSQMGDQLVGKFHQATESFVDALKKDSATGFGMLGNYLGQAQNVASEGTQSSQSFFDQMIEAADVGIKALTNSMQSQSWMQGMNLSMDSSSSSAMPGTSAVDIAKLYLSNSFSSMDKQLSSGYSGSKNYGLELISSKEISMASSDASSVSSSSSSDRKIQMLEKFMGMVEDFLGGFKDSDKEDSKSFFQFSIYKHVAGISAELEKEVSPTENTEASSDKAAEVTKTTAA